MALFKAELHSWDYDGAITFEIKNDSMVIIQPDGDVLTNWTSTAATHYTEVDEDEESPDGLDYVASVNNQVLTESFTMESPDLSDYWTPKVYEIIVRSYGAKIAFDWETWVTGNKTGMGDQDLTFFLNTYLWRHVTFTGLSLTQADLNDLEIAYRKQAADTHRGKIGCIYAEIYVQENPCFSIPASWIGHNLPLKIADDDGAVAYTYDYDFAAAQMTGTTEYWIGSDDVAKGFYIYLRDGTDNDCVKVYIDADKLKYNAGVNIDDMTDNTPIHIRIAWDCTANTFSLWLDTVSKLTDVAFNTVDDGSGLDKIVFITDVADSGYNCYIDAIDFSWATGYSLNRNYLDTIDVTNDIIYSKIREELYTTSDGMIRIKGDGSEYEPGHELDFYDKNDVLSWTGRVLSPESTLKSNTTYITEIKLIGLDSKFDNDYRKNFSTVRDSDYILKYIVDNGLTRYHSYDDIDNFTITYKYDFKKYIWKLWYYLAMLERGVIHYKPDGELFFNKYDNLSMRYATAYDGAPDNFNDETQNKSITAASDMEFIDVLTLPNACTCDLALIDSHYNCIKLTHDGGASDPDISHNYPNGNEVSGSREWWSGCSDNTKYTRLIFLSSTASKILIVFNINGKIYHYPNNVWTDTGKTFSNDILLHFRVDYDCDAGTNGQYQLYINGDQIGGDHEMRSAATFLSGFKFDITTAAVYSSYLDAWGDPANSEYYAGKDPFYWINGTTKKTMITKHVPQANRFVTRAPVIGAYNSDGQIYVVGVGADKAEAEAQHGIIELRPWRDPEISNYTEANQLASNRQAMYSLDTQFVYITCQNKGHIQIGYHRNIKSTEVFIITAANFLAIRRTWYPNVDISELVLTDNVLSERVFNTKVVGKFYDDEAESSFEDADVSESSADGTVLELRSVACVRARAPSVFTGGAPPTIDETDDVKIGDLFVDTTNMKAYICLDDTDGAPDWNQIDL